MDVGENGEISVTDLMLDQENPRHEPVSSQRAAIKALLEEGGEKILKLAEDIVEHGLNPTDSLLVIKLDRARSYTVVEGNRRVAALKLLANPELATTEKQKKKLRQLRSAGKVPHQIRCARLATRQEARHWMTLRHGGERGGVGVSPWGAVAVQRFAGRRGTQADYGIIFLDGVEKAYGSDPKIAADIAKIRRDKITTLGRYVQDPAVRSFHGFDFEDGELRVHYSDDAFKPVAARILDDIANAVTVTSLKSKEQRSQHARKIALPPAEEYHEGTTSLGSAQSRPRRLAKKTAKKATQSAGPNRIFEDVEVANLGKRIADLLTEAKGLNADETPTAALALIRVVIDIAVGHVYSEKNLTPAQELKDGVSRCLKMLDSTGKDPKWAQVRAGLSDRTSMLSIKTLNGYLHSPHFVPSGAEARRLSETYAEFLKGLDTLV